MTLYNNLLAIIMVGVVSSCVSTSGPEYEESEVLERLGGRDETPEWADGSKVMWEEDQNVLFTNNVRMDGNARPSACMKAAALNAKVEMLKYIKQNITSSGQFDDSSFDSDPAFESLTAFLSQGSISGASVKEQYWEKSVESNAEGARVLRLSCSALVSVKKSQLAKQLREATTAKRSGDPAIRDA